MQISEAKVISKADGFVQVLVDYCQYDWLYSRDYFSAVRAVQGERDECCNYLFGITLLLGDECPFSYDEYRDSLHLIAKEFSDSFESVKADRIRSSLAIEPIASVHIQGNDFEEVLTESDFEPEKAVVDENLKQVMIRNIWSRAVRQKPRRGVRLLVYQDWTGANRYSFDRRSRLVAKERSK